MATNLRPTTPHDRSAVERFADRDFGMDTTDALPMTPYFALADPTLAPRMVASWRAAPMPFPFNHPSVRYYYMGRYATYALFQSLNLSGAEMLVPSFIDQPVLYAPQRAGIPVRFYNVRPDFSSHIDDIRAALTPETKAIYLVHFNGFPGPIDEVMALARERNLIVVEDAAHALQTSVNGRPVGSFGDGAIYSLYKWLPVPNGGAAVLHRPGELPSPENYHRPSGVALTTFSMLDHLAATWGPAGWRVRNAIRAGGRRLSRLTRVKYVVTGGDDFREEELELAMSNISHRIIRAQNLPRISARRRRNYALLGELLRDIAPPLQGPLPDGVTPLFYATSVEDKREVVRQLQARGVQAVNLWEGIPLGVQSGDFPDTDELRRTTLELPIHQDLSEAAVHRMARAVRDVLGSPSHGV